MVKASYVNVAILTILICDFGKRRKPVIPSHLLTRSVNSLEKEVCH